MSKVIVITGASGGIGAALAVQLGQQGHRLDAEIRSPGLGIGIQARGRPGGS